MRKKVWFSIFPGLGLKGVIVKSFYGWHKVIYRGIGGNCHSDWIVDFWGNILFERK